MANTEKKSTANHGGKRKGAGRPAGSKDQVSKKGLLETLYARTGGQDYEELLVADFLEARQRGDSQLTMKYHQLILQKVMTSLAKIEVVEPADVIESKQAAFAEALAKLTNALQG